jgi:hypothetical protein
MIVRDAARTTNAMMVPLAKLRYFSVMNSNQQILDAIRWEIADEYSQPHDKPWIVGFSGGKIQHPGRSPGVTASQRTPPFRAYSRQRYAGRKHVDHRIHS